MQKHNTREQIHSGLSQRKDESKWSDLLNLRSSDNRTFVVPRKFKLFECNAGFHTVLHGLNNECFAIGDNASVCFKAHDDTAFTRLWRVRVISNSNAQQPLCVRGGYTRNVAHTCGTDPETHTFNLSMLKKDILLPPVVVVPPAPPVEEPEPTGCPLLLDGKTHITVLDADSNPVPAAFVQVYDGRLLLFEGTTNALGALAIDAKREALTVRVTKEDGRFVDSTIDSCSEKITISFVNPFYGLQIIARYSSTEGPGDHGHQCDSATYKLFGNGIDLGEINLNNKIDGGDREVIITLTEEQAESIALINNNQIEFSFKCDPTNPAYEHGTNWGETCHVSAAWVIVKNAKNEELYNNVPVGNFFTLVFS